jgi:hypothetical protein
MHILPSLPVICDGMQGERIRTVNLSINPIVSDVIWIQTTFIPEELGTKSSNQANFLKFFNLHRLSNRWIRTVSYPTISMLTAGEIL